MANHYLFVKRLDVYARFQPRPRHRIFARLIILNGFFCYHKGIADVLYING